MARFSRNRIFTGKKVLISDLGNVLIGFTGQEDNPGFYSLCSASREEIRNFFRPAQPNEFTEYESRQNWTREFYEIVKQKLGFRGSIEEFKAVFSNMFSLKLDVYDLYFTEIKPVYDIDFCVLSNINELHHEEIRRRWPGISANCVKEWYSYKLACRKPDPAIYEIVLGNLKEIGIGGHECIFVDDLEENIEAAKRCGIASSIRFESAEQLRAALASLGLKT